MSVANPLSGYQRDWLRFDVLAGVSMAAVVIPKAMAFAVIAGLPVESVFTLPSSYVRVRTPGELAHVSVSSTTALAIAAAAVSSVVPVSEPARMVAAAATLALLTGAFLLLAGVLRTGVPGEFHLRPRTDGQMVRAVWSAVS